MVVAALSGVTGENRLGMSSVKSPCSCSAGVEGTTSALTRFWLSGPESVTTSIISSDSFATEGYSSWRRPGLGSFWRGCVGLGRVTRSGEVSSITNTPSDEAEEIGEFPAGGRA